MASTDTPTRPVVPGGRPAGTPERRVGAPERRTGTSRSAAGTRERPVVDSILERLQPAGRVDTVFGAPVERDGITVLPAAAVRTGGGGGGGGGTGVADHTEEETGETTGYGEGGGFGLDVRPVGAFVLQRGRVSWQPAMDWTRVVLAGEAVLVVLLLTRWRTRRAQARAAARREGGRP